MSEHITFRGPDGMKSDLDDLAEREGYEDRSDLLREICNRVVAETPAPDTDTEERARADGGTVSIDPGVIERTADHHDPALYDLSFRNAREYRRRTEE